MSSTVRVVRVPGLPDFNAGDWRYNVSHEFVGWFSTSGREVKTAPKGGGPGLVFTRVPRRKAKFPTLAGWVECTSRAHLEQVRRDLVAAFPDDADSPVTVLGDGDYPDLTGWFRIYDEPTLEPDGNRLNFTLPLIQPDPFKYALIGGAATMGVFSGGGFYRLYTDDGAGAFYRLYTDDGAGAFDRVYTADDAVTTLPNLLNVTNSGDADSTRYTVTIVGPLAPDDYFVTNETTDEALGASLTLAAGQSLVLDMHRRRATLAGTVVTRFVSGVWPRLAPGVNTLRLDSGTPNDTAYAVVSDTYSAYQ